MHRKYDMHVYAYVYPIFRSELAMELCLSIDEVQYLAARCGIVAVAFHA